MSYLGAAHCINLNDERSSPSVSVSIFCACIVVVVLPMKAYINTSLTSSHSSRLITSRRRWWRRERVSGSPATALLNYHRRRSTAGSSATFHEVEHLDALVIYCYEPTPRAVAVYHFDAVHLVRPKVVAAWGGRQRRRRRGCDSGGLRL